MENSEISWTDHTFNPWRGCTKVSAACANCYAETLSKRNRLTLGTWGPEPAGGTRVAASEDYWTHPEKWNRTAAAEGIRFRVFCASLADVFEEWHGPIHDGRGRQLFDVGDGWEPAEKINPREYPGFRADAKVYHVGIEDVRARLFELIENTPALDWLLLTKRPENVLAMAPARWRPFPPNVWIGTTVENQEAANDRIPQLLKIPAAVRFLSCEPLLGPIDFGGLRCGEKFDGEGAPYYNALRGASWWPNGEHGCHGPAVDWVIAGGESGPGARKTDPDWFRVVRDQCAIAGVPFHFKQWGTYVELGCALPGHPMKDAGRSAGDKKGGRILDGRTHDEFPTLRS